MSIPIISFGDCDSCGRSAHNIIQAWHIRYGYKDYSLTVTGVQNSKRYLTETTQEITTDVIRIGGQRYRRWFKTTTIKTTDRWTNVESTSNTSQLLTTVFVGESADWRTWIESTYEGQTLTTISYSHKIYYYISGPWGDLSSYGVIETTTDSGVSDEYTDEQILSDLDTILAGPWYDPLTGNTVSSWEDPLYFDMAWKHYFYYFAFYDPVAKRNVLIDLRNRRCESIQFGEPTTVYSLPTYVEVIGMIERDVQIIKPLDSVWESYERRWLMIGYELDRKPVSYFGEIKYDTTLDSYSQAVGWFPAYNISLNLAMMYNTMDFSDYLVATKTKALLTIPWTAEVKRTDSDRDFAGNKFTRPLPFRHERSNDYGKFNNYDEDAMDVVNDLVVDECGESFEVVAPSYNGSKQRYYCLEW